MASRRRSAEPTGKPRRYQAMCLRRSRTPRSSPRWSASSWACRRRTAVTAPSVGSGGRRRGVEGRVELGEQPGAAEAAAADHDAVGAGLGGHGQRVRGGEDVAVAEHRQPSRAARPAAGRWRPSRPGRSTAVRRSGRAGRRRRLLPRRRHDPRRGRCDARSSMPMRIFTVTGSGSGCGDRGVDDGAEQPPLVGQCGAAAATGDLGHRAAEVQVDVVGEVLAGRSSGPRRAPSPGRRRRAAATSGARRRRR